MREFTEVKDNCRSPDYEKFQIQFKSKKTDKDSVLLIIERCPSGCMPLWVKHGYVKEVFPWWHISVYATDKDGYTWGRYNPQEKPFVRKDDKGKIVESRNTVVFDWVLPATEENRQKIIAEVSRLAFGE